jgi:hypothetical protein
VYWTSSGWCLTDHRLPWQKVVGVLCIFVHFSGAYFDVSTAWHKFCVWRSFRDISNIWMKLRNMSIGIDVVATSNLLWYRFLRDMLEDLQAETQNCRRSTSERTVAHSTIYCKFKISSNINLFKISISNGTVLINTDVNNSYKTNYK